MTENEMRAALDRIHLALCDPYEWSSETPEYVAAILTRCGYRWPDETETAAMRAEPDHYLTIDQLAPWRPA